MAKTYRQLVVSGFGKDFAGRRSGRYLQKIKPPGGAKLMGRVCAESLAVGAGRRGAAAWQVDE